MSHPKLDLNIHRHWLLPGLQGRTTSLMGAGESMAPSGKYISSFKRKSQIAALSRLCYNDFHESGPHPALDFCPRTRGSQRCPDLTRISRKSRPWGLLNERG